MLLSTKFKWIILDNSIPVPLKDVIEVFEDVDRVKHREEGCLRFQIFNEQLQCTFAKFSEELDVGFVSISQNKLHVETNFLKFGKNIKEVTKLQSWCQSCCRDKADQIFIAAMQWAHEERQESFGWSLVFISEEFATNVFHSLRCEYLNEGKETETLNGFHTANTTQTN